VILSADATRYIHAHPITSDRDQGAVTFAAHFPAAGVYKGWAQFRRGGRLHTIPLVVRVND
jgi:hypothetical protein